MTKEKNNLAYQGLNPQEVASRQKRFGKNALYTGRARHIFRMLWDVAREPMFLILIAVCSIYFFLGNIYEGQIMLFAMAMVVIVSIYQEVRSANAIKSLKKYTQSSVLLIREGEEVRLPAAELVPDDIVILSEGETVPADAIVLRQNDFSVDESIMTGESMPVFRDAGAGILQGTLVASGLCTARVTKTGTQTELARLGKRMEGITQEKSLLQKQVSAFVQRMALVGLLAFLLVFGINYLSTFDLVVSLLFGLVMTMSLIPEEIPVAFSSFMAIGAYRMSKIGLLVKQPITVESLGSASVICLDKTGTITENRMSLAAVYDFEKDKLIEVAGLSQYPDNPVLAYAMWASEPMPFDPMEKALHQAYRQNAAADAREQYQMVHEYPLEGRPPMMTHIWQRGEERIIAAKGAVERILAHSPMPEGGKAKVEGITHELAAKGFRVLGVARALVAPAAFPERQDDFEWQFLGLAALYDPPKKGIREVFSQFYQAGIQVKMITGDYAATALTIAGESGLRHNGQYLLGEAVMNMPGEKLREAVDTVNIFARMFPEAKFKVVEALKANGQIVAMTGDGVNDGPALKAAHIGVAMGDRGTDIAKKAAALVITDDKLEKMAEAIANGRKIYHNLKKAIRYIISIHIPIILVVLMPLVLNWEYRNIFSPVHIIFLEMIMGPTCSIFFENEPMETGVMSQKPRDPSASLFSWRELSGSILQGLIIACGVLGAYYWAMASGMDEASTRTMAFITLIISNIFLTLVNRSFRETIFTTIRYPNNLLPLMLGASLLLLAALQFVPVVRTTFHLSQLTPHLWAICALIAFLTVFWFEGYKLAATSKAATNA
ncbi:MAG: cation-translocating P-type ATPase [Lewinellaceae bacterium]|nr:cation-translocating P-type ATPase [Phaeodactylibacter sp.]MCB9038262.1 cation-translocating P-type ATPase [Lewinellaceae bacterium]